MEVWGKNAQTKQSLKLITVKLKSHEALMTGTHVLAGICQCLIFSNGRDSLTLLSLIHI